jgi:antirestriction protein ArdC
MSALFEAVTKEIISAIEAGAEDFRMPWHRPDSLAGLPRNALTGRTYRGGNVLLLWAAATRTSFSSPLWATYRQWAALGAQVRKGETGATILLWKALQAGPAGDNEGDTDDRDRFIVRASRVFNACQVDGYSAPPSTPISGHQRVEAAEIYFGAVPASVWHGSDEAFFDRRSDTISMPPFERFHRAEGYYSVLAHELTHWSGAHHRLARDLGGRFGSASYAMEELVAELGAAFTCAQLGIATTARSDHAPYIATWLTVLRNDTRAIVTAASKAQAATEYISGLVSKGSTAVPAAEAA